MTFNFTELIGDSFQILIGPAVLFWLGYCYFKIQRDPELKMASRLTVDMLESKSVPGDWTDLSGESEAMVEEENDDDDGDKNRDQDKDSSEDSEEDQEQEKKIPINGLGPIGVRGRPNKGRPDPKTMQLILLESIRKKIQDLTDDFNEKTIDISQTDYNKKIENLKKQEANILKMPTDPKTVEAINKKKMLSDARNFAKSQLAGINNARQNIFRARAENRVPDNVFEAETDKMKRAEAHFTKMVNADDEELFKMVMFMNEKARQHQNQIKMQELQRKAAKERQERDEALAEASKPKEMHIL